MMTSWAWLPSWLSWHLAEGLRAFPSLVQHTALSRVVISQLRVRSSPSVTVTSVSSREKTLGLSGDRGKHKAIRNSFPAVQRAAGCSRSQYSPSGGVGREGQVLPSSARQRDPSMPERGPAISLTQSTQPPAPPSQEPGPSPQARSTSPQTQGPSSVSTMFHLWSGTYLRQHPQPRARVTGGATTHLLHAGRLRFAGRRPQSGQCQSP